MTQKELVADYCLARRWRDGRIAAWRAGSSGRALVSFERLMTNRDIISHIASYLDLLLLFRLRGVSRSLSDRFTISNPFAYELWKKAYAVVPYEPSLIMANVVRSDLPLFEVAGAFVRIDKLKIPAVLAWLCGQGVLRCLQWVCKWQLSKLSSADQADTIGGGCIAAVEAGHLAVVKWLVMNYEVSDKHLHKMSEKGTGPIRDWLTWVYGYKTDPGA